MNKSDKLFLDLIETLAEEYQFFKDVQQKLIKEGQQEQEEEKEPLFGFSTALVWMKRGAQVTRDSWEDPIFYEMVEGDLGPYIVRSDVWRKGTMPVVLTNEDIFAEDWKAVPADVAEE